MTVVPTGDLAALIAEQELDQQFGDKVHSVSINNDVWDDDDGLIRYELGTYIFERPPYRSRRKRGLLGHNARRHRNLHAARHICVDCGDWCDHRVEVCRACFEKRTAAEHGSLRLYNTGCRCDACRQAWSEYQRAYRIQHGQPEIRPERHGLHRYRKQGCRCAACSTAYRAMLDRMNARSRERRAA